MAQTVIAEKFYQLDHNGDVIPSKVDRGIWSLETAQTGAPYRFCTALTVETFRQRIYPAGTAYGSTTLAASGAVCQIGQRINRNGIPRHGDSSQGDSRYSLQFLLSGGQAFVIGGVDEVISGCVFYGIIHITDDVMADDATEVGVVSETVAMFRRTTSGRLSTWMATGLPSISTTGTSTGSVRISVLSASP